MTFELEMAALGRATAGLLLESPSVPAVSVRTAETAQIALYRLLDQMHRSLVNKRTVQPVTAHRIDQHPVGALGRILEEAVRARHPDARMTDVLASPPASKAEELWRGVLRHATLAAEAWQTRISAPTGDDAWSLIGDVAALSEAASVLDGDLAVALRADARMPDAETLVRGPARHLRLAGARTAALAASGQQPPSAVAPAPPQRPVLVESAASVAEGQRRLGGFLRNAVDVTPQSLFIVVALTGQSARTAATLATNAPIATALREHAQGLAEAAGRPGRCATVRPGDPRPEAQAYELRRHLRSLRPGAVGAENAADAFSGGLRMVTDALAVAAGRQERQGRWLVPVPEPGVPMWQRSGVDVELVPPFIDDLERLAEAARRDPRLVPVEQPTPSVRARALVPPRTTLAYPLRSIGLPAVRPAVPGQAPTPTPGRNR